MMLLSSRVLQFPIHPRQDSSILMSLYKQLYFFSRNKAFMTQGLSTENAFFSLLPYLVLLSLMTLMIDTSDGNLGSTLAIEEISWKKLTIWPLTPKIPFLM
jgi:hypothetical protein